MHGCAQHCCALLLKQGSAEAVITISRVIWFEVNQDRGRAVTISLPLQDSNTSLHYASSHGHTELCELLIGTKADVGAKDEVLEATRGGQK